MAEGMFPCAEHKYSTNSTKSISEQEDEWYQHLRDHEHTYRINTPCRDCGKKIHKDKVRAKVPQPTPDVKNPRAIIVFCDDNCRKDYLKKLGVTV